MKRFFTASYQSYVVEVLDARLQAVQHIRALLVVLRVWVEVAVVTGQIRQNKTNEADGNEKNGISEEKRWKESNALTSHRSSGPSDQSDLPRKR